MPVYPLWEKIIRAVTRSSLGLLGEGMLRRVDAMHPYANLPNGELLDYDDSDFGDEPVDIEYDDGKEPCEPPPHPWTMPDRPEDGDGDGGDDGGVPLALASEESCKDPAGLMPKPMTDVKYAGGEEEPFWPIRTTKPRKLKVSYQDVRGKWHGKWGRHFGASRKSNERGDRIHTGVDVFADGGDVVLAMEPGTIIAPLPFYKGTGAIYVLHDSGIIVNYGELERGSWWDFDLGSASGKRVEKGQPLGRVGVSNSGSHMLHLETFSDDVTLEDIRSGKMKWPAGSPPPEGLLDPTEYLMRALEAHKSRIS